MNDPQQELAEFLGPQSSWKHRAFTEICNTPSGYLISYGSLSRILHESYDIAISPRTLGWFRRQLYSILSHDTTVPLHRVATKGDVDSLNDSEDTKQMNDRLRGEEGSLAHPQWR